MAICAHPGCITRLSRYNADERCYVHRTPASTLPDPGNAPAARRQRVEHETAAVLPGTRYQIADALGLSVQTVERRLQRMIERGLVVAHGKAGRGRAGHPGESIDGYVYHRATDGEDRAA